MKRFQLHLVLLHLVLLHCLLQFWYVHSTAMHSNDTEKVALLAFKAGLTNGLDALSSWNESTHFCEWIGITCSRRYPQMVSTLDLSMTGIFGTVSPFIGKLTSLRRINLASNNLYGEIPSSVSFLHRLKFLDLSYNSFGGKIATGLKNCSNLVYIDLSFNQIEGEIPSWLGSFSMLHTLYIVQNNLTGTIPLSLGNLSSLHNVSLSRNYLEGNIPKEFSFLPNLQIFHVSINNLSGTIPYSFYNQSSLIDFRVASNELEGKLPLTVANNLPNLRYFFIDINNFIGPIPTWFSNSSNMYWLSLGANKFNGTIPAELGKLCPSQINLQYNELEATNTKDWNFLRFLSNCSHLQVLGLESNSLGGAFPNYIANLTTLQELTIGANYLSGPIPSEIGNLVNLTLLGLYDNKLTGLIPKSMGNLQQLQELDLGENMLSGPIPSSFGNLTKLIHLNATNNRIQGHIPINFANLQRLIFLDLSNNVMDGILPKSIFVLPLYYLDLSNNSLTGKLLIEVSNLCVGYLNLSRNKFYGELPELLNDYESLEHLDLSFNLFNGTIPLFLKSKGILELNLSNNKFNGTIPQELSYIYGLQKIDFSHNNLFGNIPVLLEKLSSLFVLDLSFNRLVGPVPTKGIFNNISGISISENAGLCGGIPQLLLPMCPNQKIYSFLFIIRIMLSCIVILLVSLITIILILRKRVKPREKETSYLLLEESYPKVSYAELVKATKGFSAANLLGAGRHGSVFKGILPSKHKQTQYHAIKVFNLEIQGTSNSFLAECDVLRRVRHRNLVGIKTCCSSTNSNGNEFKALVFDFMPNGSLDRWLRQQGDMVLSFMERLNIAVDVADAIDYLHNYCDPLIVHCDLKPGNILLGEDFTAHVSDFGLAKLLPNSGSAQMMNSENSVGIRGSIGYITPEYWAGVPVSTWGDVYSFGIILLEMFTGKMPVDDMFKDGLTLRIFAERYFPDNLHDIVDPKLILFESDYDLEIQNKHNGDSWNKICKFFTLVIRVGLLCSMHSPTDRKSIRDAAAELHYIRDAFIRSR